MRSDSVTKVYLYFWDFIILGFSYPNYKIHKVGAGVRVLVSELAFLLPLPHNINKIEDTFSYSGVSFRVFFNCRLSPNVATLTSPRAVFISYAYASQKEKKLLTSYKADS